ncbi:protein angel homolog 2 isoform 7-T9 [Alca torda]
MQRNSILADYSSCTASALFSTIVFHMLCTAFPYRKRSQHLPCPQKTSRKRFSCIFKHHGQEQERTVHAAVGGGGSVPGACRAGSSPQPAQGSHRFAEPLRVRFNLQMLKFCLRHSMLPRHVQRLGRDWIAHWNGSQILALNSPVSNCTRWAGCYPWASFPLPVPVDFSANWRVPPFLGPWRQFQNSNWQLDNFTQSSCFHLPNPSMKSEGEEPLTKRRRLSDQHDTSAPEEETNFSNQKEALCLSVAQNEEKHSSKKGTIKRRWEYFCQHSRTMKIFENKETNQSNTESEAKFDFTVMSYNILSQNLLEDNSHLYKHCRQRLLIWTYRFPNILQEIKQLDADVLCLQEVQEDHYRTEIKSSLESLGEKLEAAKLDDTQEVIIAPEKLSSKLQHHFKLSSVYSHYFPETGIPEVTTCHSRSAVTVDYIFYSAANDDATAQPGAEDSFHGGLKLLGRLALLTEKDLWTVNGLPNENNSSDHLPLLAEFRLIER